ncbi:phytanoyl-CoA dioxygenase family protein [Paenibacillus sacheonensis]|uniref:Phytanoyl-CoA dioxygenase n=1 Tax=Paenibacillus sacheonensis TaxID=742054 RepID=A0A7X4YRW5_9BACL|nr:phytanoyl-CoA dioxygenase family protein [Paenibacillus sacheonensis]MBM7566815.1 ectoine hydroxylase-related dioxygenase (phytanoyl-CoA dioxygenase family) [Paenibacillus sacheonensis]NBC71437.1 phytanoyl-CoA dioxygenase [Paenibacillus sacheonensis]
MSTEQKATANPSAFDLEFHKEEFFRNGFTLVRNVLSEEFVDAYRIEFEREFTEKPHDGYGDTLRTKMFERGDSFLRMIDRPEAVAFAEAVLGKNCHMFSNNGLYTKPGTGIDFWHVDEDLFFEIPEGALLDPRIQMPCFMFSAMYYLQDVTEDMGPTQLVPGSHRSGREPASPKETPYYNGQGPVSILAKKGDMLLFNGQTWHRGAKNESDRVRMVQQVTYGRRWVSQRFYPFVNYVMPQSTIDGAKDNPRLTRLLGFHPRGPYG